MMSRRRRRGGDDDVDALSESEQDQKKEQKDKLSLASESDIEDELDLSDYESLEEEEPNSSEDEAVVEPAANENVENEPEKDSRVKVILERKPEFQQPDTTKENLNLEKKDLNFNKEDLNLEKEDLNLENPERESGDGKEESDSEYQKNETAHSNDDKNEQEDDPAFIPTRGAFFQHDLRSDKQSSGRSKDRKLWDKGPVKWSHDMFIMEDQMPKTRDILISNYGYDIREHPTGAPLPNRRMRGRGRGRGGYRGRSWGGRGRNSYQENQRSDRDNYNPEYNDDYPAPGEEDGNVAMKHKSKSYYSTQRYNNNNRKATNKSSKEKTNQYSGTTDTGKDNAENAETDRPLSPLRKPEDKKEEKLNDLLQVIQNRENAPPSNDTVSRKGDQTGRNRQNTSFSNYEAPKPRRYSSLRQKHSDPMPDRRNSPIPPQFREQKYANFTRPSPPTSEMTRHFAAQVNASANMANGSLPARNSSGSPSVPRPIEQQIAFSQSQVPMPLMQQNAPANIPAGSLNMQSLPFADPTTQALLNTQMDPTMMQMQQSLQYYPMMSPAYIEAASNYQRMLRMLSQVNMSMEQMQQMPGGVASQLDASTPSIPPDAQTLPHPGDMQLNSLVPPVTQALSPGSLGSVIRPSHSINPATYFTGPMNMPVPQPQQHAPQAAMNFPPSLVAQQVGGVTYFNTATQSPPVQQLDNQASPRRNAAIPILAPTGFPGPTGYE